LASDTARAHSAASTTPLDCSRAAAAKWGSTCATATFGKPTSIVSFAQSTGVLVTLAGT
jgi:hypothetical protein